MAGRMWLQTGYRLSRARAYAMAASGTRTAEARSDRMPSFVRRFLTGLGTIAASPWAFTTVALYVLLWLVFDPGSLNWHGIATLATWCMTLFIQRSEHRDTQAIHAKLDELLKAQPHASDRLARIDEEEPEEIERHRKRGKDAAGRSGTKSSRSE